MNTSFPVNGSSWPHVYVHFPLKQASTFHDDYMVVESKSAVAEANSIIQDEHVSYLREIALREIADDTDEEELEWDTLFSQPHVQAGLNRLAETAMRQREAGEIEEGGFGIE